MATEPTPSTYEAALATSYAVTSLAKRVGVLRVSLLLSVLMNWATVMRRHDWQPITVEQYEKSLKVGRATAFRHQALYRKAFPGEDNPNERILAARAAWLAAQPDSDPKPTDLAGFAAGMAA